MTDESSENRWFGLGVSNLVVLALALLAIVGGYVLLDRGSITAAPALLVVGYVVLIPLALLLGYRKVGGGEEDETEEAEAGGSGKAVGGGGA